MERSASVIWAARAAGLSAATGGPATVVGATVVGVVVGAGVVDVSETAAGGNASVGSRRRRTQLVVRDLRLTA
jgi:hypothetical protein